MKKENFNKEIRGITIKDLMKASEEYGRWKGEAKALKDVHRTLLRMLLFKPEEEVE